MYEPSFAFDKHKKWNSSINKKEVFVDINRGIGNKNLNLNLKYDKNFKNLNIN